MFNSLCLNTMLVCSVGTLLLNGNPLLRYDGYYILSDWLEVPNLAAQSSSALRRVLARWCLGMDIGAERERPARRSGLLSLYAVASIVYRFMIVIAVLWALGELAKPYGLRPLVALVGGATLAAMVWSPVAAAAHWIRHPAPRQRIAPLRAALSFALLAVAATAALFVPGTHARRRAVVVEFRDAQRVYVNVPGTLAWNVAIGEKIEEGEPPPAGQLQVDLEVARLTAERDTQRLLLVEPWRPVGCKGLPMARRGAGGQGGPADLDGLASAIPTRRRAADDSGANRRHAAAAARVAAPAANGRHARARTGIFAPRSA